MGVDLGVVTCIQIGKILKGLGLKAIYESLSRHTLKIKGLGNSATGNESLPSVVPIRSVRKTLRASRLQPTPCIQTARVAAVPRYQRTQARCKPMGKRPSETRRARVLLAGSL